MFDVFVSGQLVSQYWSLSFFCLPDIIFEGIYFLQNGYTALIMACIKDNTDVVRELLRSPHIDVNLQDNVRD